MTKSINVLKELRLGLHIGTRLNERALRVVDALYGWRGGHTGTSPRYQPGRSLNESGRPRLVQSHRHVPFAITAAEQRHLASAVGRLVDEITQQHPILDLDEGDCPVWFDRLFSPDLITPEMAQALEDTAALVGEVPPDDDDRPAARCQHLAAELRADAARSGLFDTGQTTALIEPPPPTVIHAPALTTEPLPHYYPELPVAMDPAVAA